MLVLCHSVNRSLCSYQAYIYKARCSRCHDEIWTCVCVRGWVCVCCVCVYTVITNGFSSVYCACTIIKSRGQRYPMSQVFSANEAG